MFDPRTDLEDARNPSITRHDMRQKPVAGDSFMPDNRNQDPEQAMKNKTKFLVSDQAQRLHDVLSGHYLRELDRQSLNRMEMAADEDMFDHIQYSQEDIEILEDRGQVPIVFNLVQTTVNWLLGTQRRAPTDFRILARKKDGLQAAERKTELMKFVSDANSFVHEESMAFAGAVKAGMGWIETGQGGDDDPAKVVMRSESWRNMLWDSTAVKYGLEDARYIMRTKWLDTDTAISLWPNRQAEIEMSRSAPAMGITSLDDLGDDAMDSVELEHFGGLGSGMRGTPLISRDRVRIMEVWFKRNVTDARTMKGGQFDGEIFDPWSEGHIIDLNAGFASLIARPRQIVHVAIMCERGLLDLRRSPYRHNQYPFTPVWGYRRARDGMPYGLIRGLRDIQRDLNRRAAKSLHHLSTTRITVQEGAVPDLEELRNEAARPDGIIIHKAGHPAPQIHTDTQVASAHLEMMDRDASMIQQVGGVTDENLGRKTNASSGIAIERRQNQGALSTSMFFDNLTQSRRQHGAKVMVNIETFYSEQEEFRITDARGNPDWRNINDGETENAIAAFKADFVITEEDHRSTMRQAQAAQLLELATQLSATAPQIVVGILDLIVESLDVPKRDELVKRIRQITGATDPDADPNNPTPEMVAQQKAQAEQQEMQKRQAMAALSEVEAKARKITAEATKAESNAATDMIGQLKAAMEAATQIAGAPAVAAAADQILAEARAEAGLKPDFQQPAPEQQQQPPAPMMEQPAPEQAQMMPEQMPQQTPQPF